MAEIMNNKSWLGTRIQSEEGDFGTIRFQGWVSNVNVFGIDWENPERGKHDGTYKGVDYFKTSYPTSGSFVPVHSKKLLFPRTFLSALYEKYTQESSDVRLTFGANKQVQVETVGWEKIQEKQKHLEMLMVVGLAEQRIGLLDHPDEIQNACPRIQDLDLSKNLLKSWEDVSAICKELPSLTSLRLSFNQFDSALSSVFHHAFDKLQSLTVNATRMSWDQMEHVASFMPSLEELHFGWNHLTDLGYAGKRVKGTLCK